MKLNRTRFSATLGFSALFVVQLNGEKVALCVAFLRGFLPITMCGAIYFSNLHNKKSLLACLLFFVYATLLLG